MSQCYPKAREKFLRGQIDWVEDDFKAILLPPSYAPNFADEFLDDVLESVVIATSEAIENKSATNGYADADPIKFTLLLDPRTAAQAIIFKDTGSAATSPLIFYMSVDMLLGAPFALQGANYFIHPDAAEGGFFRL